MKAQAITGPMRIPFLVVAPVCVLAGICAAHLQGVVPQALDVVALILAAIFAHIAVNALNEYHDFRSGLDAKTTRTPFSGGSGALPAQTDGTGTPALVVTIVAIVLTLLVGVWFAIRGRSLVLPFGIVGVLLVVFYTPTVVRSPVLCLLAPGLGFGPCIVLGSEAALTGTVTWPGVILSLVPLFLVSGLLLVNQFPDIEPDRSVGRRTVPIVYGPIAGVRIYGVLLAGTFLSIIIPAAAGVIPPASLLGLVPLPLAVWAYVGAMRRHEAVGRYIPVMAANVVIVLLTPSLEAVGLLVF